MKNLSNHLVAWSVVIGLAASATSVTVFAQDPPKKDPPKDQQDGKDKDKKKEDRKDAPKGPEIGKPAPAFELKDLDGKVVKLADFKDKIVVLEWFNPECPVASACHTSGELKDMAARVTKDGIVWLAINSGAPGKQGADPEVNKKTRAEWKLDHPILLDDSGDVGRKYGAQTTPHMFVIDAKGMLVYKGAIDNQAKGKPEDGKVINYVDAALADLKAGKPVAKSQTQPYGCGVKYGKPKA